MTIAHEYTTTAGTPTVAYDDNQTQFDVWATEVVATMYVYYTPLLVVLGVIGNLASVYIFQTSKLRLQSTSQYLSALALSDTIFLLQLLAPWLSAAQLSGLFHNSGYCQIFMYVSYVSCCASAWFVVAFTIERFVAVVYPLRRNSVCTVARARFAVATVALLSLLINTPVLRFAAPRDGYCNIDRDYLLHAARFNVLDTAITFTVPLTLIVILNCWITFRVCRVERARRQLRGDAGATPACPQQRVTRMLLTVSTVFVVLNLPAYTIRVCAYAYGTGTDFTGLLNDQNADEVGGRWTALQQILVMFFHTNFSINFVLYCLSGQNFRRALVQTLPWYRARARRAAAVRRAAIHRARATSISSECSRSYVSTCTDAGLNATAGATPATRRRSACTITGVHETNGGTPAARRLSACTVAGAAPPARRHAAADRFIQRWTFDNSRQRASAASSAALRSPDVEAIEMRLLGVPSRHRAGPAASVATTQI